MEFCKERRDTNFCCAYQREKEGEKAEVDLDLQREVHRDPQACRRECVGEDALVHLSASILARSLE